nr:hypothetical protein [Tanacetum cinerariifolium]
EEEQSVRSYVLKMKGCIDNLERLGHFVTLGLRVSLILISLRKEFDDFMQNYNMHSLKKTINELHAMLKLYEQTLPKNNAHALYVIRAGKVQKVNKHKKSQPQMAARGQNHRKGKNKLAYAHKPKIPSTPKREDPAKDSICHECDETGHWRGIVLKEDTHPSINTSLNHKEDDIEIDEPQSDIIPIRRSIRTCRPTYRMCLYIDVEEHELGDLGEPANYKAAFLDPESDKWLNAMNMEMQSIKDNEVWVFVKLPPNGKTVGSKWLFKKKTDMDGAVYTPIKLIYRDRSRQLIGLCQSAYVEKILKCYHMENSKREIIPMQEKLRLSKSQGDYALAELKRMQNVSYASVVGSIMYDVRCTRPDVANTKDMFLVYEDDIKRELMVSCYTDAGYLTDADDLKSQTGYVFVLIGSAVDWKSAKQRIFATSSAKDEYIAAFDASKEAVWVRKFISRLGIVPTIEEPINMYCDNTEAIVIANESRITKGARHFRAKLHYLREVIDYGDVKLEKVHTDDNLADPFTKALAFPKHSKHTMNIRMLPASSLMCIIEMINLLMLMITMCSMSLLTEYYYPIKALMRDLLRLAKRHGSETLKTWYSSDSTALPRKDEIILLTRLLRHLSNEDVKVHYGDDQLVDAHDHNVFDVPIKALVRDLLRLAKRHGSETIKNWYSSDSTALPRKDEIILLTRLLRHLSNEDVKVHYGDDQLVDAHDHNVFDVVTY